MKYILAFILLLIIPATSKATEYGPFLCLSGCTFAGPVLTPPDGITQLFIPAVVNRYNDGKYEPGDTIVICNGTTCATYSFRATTFVLKSKRADTGGPYINSAAEGSVELGANGGPSASYVMPGFGVVGFRAIYMWSTIVINGVNYRQLVLVGYEPVYGQYNHAER